MVAGCRSPSREPAGYLVIGIESYPLQLDPRYSTDANSARVGHLIYNSLLRGDERIQFNYYLSAPQIKTFGFCDEACNLDLSGSHDCSDESAARWAEALREELERIAR